MEEDTRPCTDLGNAERFNDYYGEKLRYIPELKRWVRWTTHGWHSANGIKLAKPVVRDIYKEAHKCPDSNRRVELGQWAKKSESKAVQRFMVDLASVHMETSLDAFDCAAHLVNCRNGVVNLKTKELIPHAPQQLHLKQVNADYLPEETCHRWRQFLAEIFDGDRELIDWIQVAIGYSLMGLTTEHCFFLCYGIGRNGKGVFLETIREVLGDYGSVAEFETFLQKDKSNVREMEAVGNLKGKRFVIASETSDNTRLNEALIKRLTGGDKLLGSKLHASSFEFRPTHTIWFACNHRPAIKDATVAMWERVKAIPFGRSFLGDEQEKGLKDTLQKEYDGILAWAVEGAYQYLQHGLPKDPQVCVEATGQYRQANDKLSIFINECLMKEKNATVGVKTVHDRYEQWCPSANELYPTPLKFFSENMEERGIRHKRNTNGVVFLNCRLKNDVAVSVPTW
jgi:putative DNA primase/helicase